MVLSGEARRFALADVNGGTLRLADALAKGPVLVVLFKISCPVCQLALPFVQRLAYGAAEGSPEILAISQDDAAATRTFLDQYHLGLRTLIDPSRDRYPVSNALRIETVPAFFLLNEDGEVEHSFTGFVKSELEALGEQWGVQIFLPGENVPVIKPG